MVDIFYPLQWIADKLTYDVFGIAPDTHLAASVNFIIYDVMKIFVLLAVMIFVVSYIRTYVTPEKTRKVLGGKKGLQYHLLASLMGGSHPFLFLFISTTFYWLCGSRNSSRSDFLFPYHLPPGKRGCSCCTVGDYRS